MTAIVLAGGAGTRFGGPKANLTFKGRPLLPALVETLVSLADEVLVIGTQDSGRLGPARCIGDKFPRGGPLLAFASALNECNAGIAVLTACDMPFVSPALLRFQMAHLGSYDAAVPLAEGRLQPLHAVFRTGVREAADAAILGGVTSLTALTERLRVRVVQEREWSLYCPDGRCFFSVNTPDDLRFAETLP